LVNLEGCSLGRGATMSRMDGLDGALSVLGLAWRTRPGGGGSTERRFCDFVVDGVSLYERLGHPHDLISPLGWQRGDEMVR
jgi:hypothetical protein